MTTRIFRRNLCEKRIGQQPKLSLQVHRKIKLKQNPAILSKIPRKFSENSTKVKENLTKFEENPSNIKKSSNAQNFVLSFSITVISAVILLAIVSFILVKGLK